MALEGKLAVVTGASRGIGQAICELFAQEGARVVGADVEGKTLTETINSLHKKNDSQKHLAVKTDVSDSKSVDNLAEKILKFYNGEIPTIVVSNAGVVRNLKGIAFATEEVFDQVISVNLKGTFLVNRKFALMIKERKLQGSIVNVTSVNIDGFAPAPIYAASKGGILSLTKSFAKELAKDGIRFNSVRPGAIDTIFPYTANIPEEEMRQEDQGPSVVPMGRHGTPKEVAEVCLFLASDKSSYVTCADYEVHGGLHAILGSSHR